MTFVGCGRCGGFLVPGETCPCELLARRARATCPACSGALMYPGEPCACGGLAKGSRTETYPDAWGDPPFTPGTALHTAWIASNIGADLGHTPRNPAQRPRTAGLAPADAVRILEQRRHGPGEMDWPAALAALRRRYLPPLP